MSVWFVIPSEGLLDPYYFDSETVRKEGYCELLDTYVRNKFETFFENPSFQQDGAPPHMNHGVRDFLRDTFGENWIGKYGPENWPAKSPDLTPPEFFV